MGVYMRWEWILFRNVPGICCIPMPLRQDGHRRFGLLDTFVFHEQPALVCKKSLLLLACAWFCGLISGVFCSVSARDSVSALMPAALSGRLSIVSLLSAVFLPFLITALAVS